MAEQATGRKIAVALMAMVVGLLSTATPAATAFELTGKWGSVGSGDGQFLYPDGVATDGFGHVYVADTDNERIQKFTADGTFLTKWNMAGEIEGLLISPLGIATDTAANIYAVSSNRILKFDSNGKFLKEWGSIGEGDGQFMHATAIEVDSNNDVYVVDVGNFRVQKFDSEGNFLTKWGSEGSGDGQFGSLKGNPFNGVAIDRSDNVYIADTYNYRVQKFTNYGKFLGKWGSYGFGPGQFYNIPRGIATDALGNVFVEDTGRIQKFTPSGAYLDEFGPGEVDGAVPAEIPDIAIDPVGDIYVVDRINHRILKFRDSLLPSQAAINSPQETEAVPPPVAGRTVNVEVVRGVIRIRERGSRRFRKLRDGEQIPVGSVVDARRGRVRLTSATPGGATQTADLYGGVFRIVQRAANGLTELTLIGGSPKSCAKRSRRSRRRARSHRAQMAARRHGRRRGRGGRKGRGRPARLWGDGKGRFRTRGRHGSATVRGTIWLTEERCDGTFFKVRRGTVAVRDFTLGKTLRLRTGQRHLASRRRRSGARQRRRAGSPRIDALSAAGRYLPLRASD